MHDVFVIGGPNGAGKSTAAQALLPRYVGVRQFVNADEIARGLAGFAPETAAAEAGRIMLRRIRALAREGVDFAFETTLASRSFAPWLTRLRETGYRVHLLYLWIPSAEFAIRRVAGRVQAGGHDVPREIIRRRYERGRRNFVELYCRLADTWEVYDNSGLTPRLVVSAGRDEDAQILDADAWETISRKNP